MRKALVVLSPGFPADESDSNCLPPQQLFVRTLQALDPSRQVIVLSFIYPFVSKSYDWFGVKVISFGGTDKGGFYRRVSYGRVWLTLRRLRKQYQLQGMLNFWLGPAAFVGHHFARRNGLRCFTWLLGQDVRPGNAWFRRIRPLATELIALSDAVAGECEKNYGVTPAHLIPVGIDAAAFAAPPARRDIDIVGVGAFIPLKQYAVFLQMIRRLLPRFPSLRAVLCGDGPERATLELLALQSGVGPHVRFTGRLPHTDVLALLQRSRILLHPSSYEGFGAVCLEALAAGSSVVSFVRPMETAIPRWVTAADEEGMYQALRRELENERADTTPVLPFSLSDNARQVLELFAGMG